MLVFRTQTNLGIFIVLAFAGPLAAGIDDTGAGLAVETSARDGSPANIISPSSSAQSYIANQTPISPAGTSAAVSVDITDAAGQVGLHGSATGNTTGVYDTTDAGVANFNLYGYDQFNIGGTGSQTFDYTLSLGGAATGIFDTAYGGLRLLENSAYQTCCSFSPVQTIASIPLSPEGDPSGGTISGILTLQGGSTVNLGLYLWGQVGGECLPVGLTCGSGSLAQFDAVDTGNFTLTPVTTDLSSTIANGLTDSPAPVTPVYEPSSVSMLATALLLGALAYLRRKPDVRTKFRNRIGLPVEEIATDRPR
jgi:hypothetical protein